MVSSKKHGLLDRSSATALSGCKELDRSRSHRSANVESRVNVGVTSEVVGLEDVLGAMRYKQSEVSLFLRLRQRSLFSVTAGPKPQARDHGPL